MDGKSMDFDTLRFSGFLRRVKGLGACATQEQQSWANASSGLVKESYVLKMYYGDA